MSLDFASIRQLQIYRPCLETNGVSFFRDADVEKLHSIRYAELLVTSSFLEIRKRFWPRLASYWDVFWDEKISKGNVNSCHVFFSFPRKAPGFLTVNYFRTGAQTEYSTILFATQVIEQIARIRACRAIVCQVISKRISERLMKRWGYVPHAKSLGAGHYIRRLKS